MLYRLHLLNSANLRLWKGFKALQLLTSSQLQSDIWSHICSFNKCYVLWQHITCTVRTVIKAMIIFPPVLNQTQWKTIKCCSFAVIGGDDRTNIERGHKAQEVLENSSKHLQNSFIIVGLHEGFPCLLYRCQPAPAFPLFPLPLLHHSLSLSPSPSLLLYL